MSTSLLGNQSTESELLFEQYLRAHGQTDWTHEEPVDGKPATPDYRLRHGGLDYFFEVKEFDVLTPTKGHDVLMSPRWFDGYRRIRPKIHEVRKQFSDYKEYSCSLVLANPKGAFVMHDRPWAVIGAMFGNLGVGIPVGPSVRADAPARGVYLKGGKMWDPKRRKPQNTTISAIVSLTHYPVHEKRQSIRLNERAVELGRNLSTDELVDLDDSVPLVEPTQILRVIVFENPHARLPLTRDLFCGSFDERWGRCGDHIKKIFVGTELQYIEAQLVKAKNGSPLWGATASSRT